MLFWMASIVTPAGASAGRACSAAPGATPWRKASKAEATASGGAPASAARKASVSAATVNPLRRLLLCSAVHAAISPHAAPHRVQRRTQDAEEVGPGLVHGRWVLPEARLNLVEVRCGGPVCERVAHARQRHRRRRRRRSGREAAKQRGGGGAARQRQGGGQRAGWRQAGRGAQQRRQATQRAASGAPSARPAHSCKPLGRKSASQMSLLEGARRRQDAARAIRYSYFSALAFREPHAALPRPQRGQAVAVEPVRRVVAPELPLPRRICRPGGRAARLAVSRVPRRARASQPRRGARRLLPPICPRAWLRPRRAPLLPLPRGARATHCVAAASRALRRGPHARSARPAGAIGVVGP
jgi:hypothetical protein